MSKPARPNVEKIEAPKNATLCSTTTPRDPEKQSLNTAKANCQRSNMPRIHHLCFTLLILALLGLTIVSAASSQQGNENGISDTIAKERLRFQELLNSVEPSSLHEVLHTHMKDRYKHGVYQEDKHAMEVVHQENAVVAHSLLELAKRQSGNSTVIITTTASTVTQVTTTATQTSPPVTSDTSLPPTTSKTSQPASSPTITSHQVQTTSSPAVKSTSSPPVASTDGTLLGGPAAYPFAPPAPPVSSSELQSTPAPPSSLTVVPADQAQTAGSTSTNTAKASLQTNSAKSAKVFSITGVLGALGLILVFTLGAFGHGLDTN
ncbi:hypothetical protein N431DRAFT_495862 [Stipitochalara longipes BDJ]|nr:hypothetical protein N431DRAFT_495862 [Stipitochalara longipes BDJ]